jgi:hypothetical protein
MYILALSRRLSSSLYRINDFLCENFITRTANILLLRGSYKFIGYFSLYRFFFHTCIPSLSKHVARSVIVSKETFEKEICNGNRNLHQNQK